MSVRAAIQDETTKIKEYIRKMAPSDELLNDCLRLLKPMRGEQEEEELSWKDNGMYHRQIEEVAEIERSYQWIEKAGLKDSTEALIMAV